MKISSAVLFLLFFPVVFIVVPGALARLNTQLGLPQYSYPLTFALGVFLAAIAIMVILQGFILLVTIGQGTPAPTNPPRKLVTSGLYQHTRNPVLLAYILFLLAEFLIFGYLLLLVYAVAAAAGFHLYIVLWEEGELRRRFGEDYLVYKRSVPRWLPRFR